MKLKITGPLFSTEARGPIRGLGSFRKTKSGFTLVPPVNTDAGHSEEGQDSRDTFATAHEAWMHVAKTTEYHNGKKYQFRLPRWPDYWTQWLIDHGGTHRKKFNLSQIQQSQTLRANQRPTLIADETPGLQQPQFMVATATTNLTPANAAAQEQDDSLQSTATNHPTEANIEATAGDDVLAPGTITPPPSVGLDLQAGSDAIESDAT